MRTNPGEFPFNDDDDDPGAKTIPATSLPPEVLLRAINANLPVIAVRTPKVGDLSRKERDDIKPMFGDRKDAKVFEDLKRLEKSFPDAVAKIRELTQAHADDLIVRAQEHDVALARVVVEQAAVALGGNQPVAARPSKLAIGADARMEPTVDWRKM